MTGIHILIVEDEPAIADTLRYALTTEGFSVRECATAAEAYGAFAAQPADLIILDVGLPDESGFEVCRRLRRTTNVPIIFLTARDTEVDRIVGLEIGGDDYVVKPFSPREVSARVRAILRRSATVAPPAAQSDGEATPLKIDSARQLVTFFGRALELSRYEFRLLMVLSAHPGQVFSRDQLMDLVWEAPEASFDRTVDTHIKTLRAKFRHIRADVEVIVTRRGVGYALREDWSV